MRTRLTEAFGIQHPIVCAPMALVTGGRLAAAVSSAGGLGIIGGGYAYTLGGEPDLEQELAHVQGHKFGIGFITWALARVPHVLDEVLTHSPHCVFLSFGDPTPFAERIQQSRDCRWRMRWAHRRPSKRCEHSGDDGDTSAVTARARGNARFHREHR